MKFKHLLFILLWANTALLFAQPADFDKIFHPQTADEIAVMKKSPQKMVIAYSVSEEFMNGDTANYINGVKKYDADGRLIYSENYGMGTLIKYAYDNKGRVTEYFEDNGIEGGLLNFTISYTKKGAIETIENKAKAGKSISYNTTTKTILISEAGGYIYRYTLNENNLLEKVVTEYYESRPYSSTITYNKKGLVIEEKGTREVGEDIGNFVATYIYKGDKLIKVEEVLTIPFLNTTQISTISYTYNKDLLENMSFTTAEKSIAFSYIYDDGERPIQTNYFEEEELFAQQFFVYR